MSYDYAMIDYEGKRERRNIMIITCNKCGEEMEYTSGLDYCPKCGEKIWEEFVWPDIEDEEERKAFFKKLDREIMLKRVATILVSVLCILAVCGGIYFYISASKLSETEKMFYNNYRILEYVTKDDYTITVTPGQDGTVFTAKYKDTNETNTYYFLPTTITAKSGKSKTDIIVFLDDNYVGFYESLINFESSNDSEIKDAQVGFMLDYEMYQLSQGEDAEYDESEYSFTYKDDINLEKVIKKLKQKKTA